MDPGQYIYIFIYVTVPCCDEEKVDCGSVKKRKGHDVDEVHCRNVATRTELHTDMEWEDNTQLGRCTTLKKCDAGG